MTPQQTTFAICAAPMGGVGFASLFMGNWAGLILVAFAAVMIYIGDHMRGGE